MSDRFAWMSDLSDYKGNPKQTKPVPTRQVVGNPPQSVLRQSSPYADGLINESPPWSGRDEHLEHQGIIVD